MVHEASVSGNVEAIAHKEFRQSVYNARDANGLSAFHKVQGSPSAQRPSMLTIASADEIFFGPMN